MIETENQIKRQRNFARHLAFTLAEVLITLGIIGVVAEMTIPTLMNNVTNQQLIVAWKKAYTTFSQAFMQSQTNYNIDLTNSVTFKNSLAQYFKVVRDCDAAGTDCWHADGVLKTLPLPDGTQINFWDLSFCPGFVTADGMKVVLYSDGVTVNKGWAMVDVNGDKKPNVAGKDIFAIRFNNTDNKTTPFPQSDYGNCSPVTVASAGPGLTGLGCSEYYLMH